MGENTKSYDKEYDYIYDTIESLKKRNSNMLKSPNIIKIINIVEKFIQENQLICYGGMAINNILPTNNQFYNKELEFPDYDFFSKNALSDAKKLADIYHKEGYNNIEAKSGIHEGTYKVYVNFLPVADITNIDSIFFNNIIKKSIKKSNILYAPPNFLRMSMYLELSRPLGDISRWEKVYERLQLLNNAYPIINKNKTKPLKCNKLTIHNINYNKYNNNTFKKIKDILIKSKCLFFGGYALYFYSSYYKNNKNIKDIYNFDVFHENPLKCCQIINKSFDNKNHKLIYKQFNSIGKLIPTHYKVYVDNILYATIYKPSACYSYNIHNINGKKIKIGTIFTLLSMYLTYIYIDNKEYDQDKILCIADLIYNIYLKNRLKNKGILKNFTVNCYGSQEDLFDILLKKNKMYDKLKNKKKSEEYEQYFLKYNPNVKLKGGNKNITLYYFYFDECPYCQSFNEIWENIIKKEEFKNINTKKIHKEDKLSSEFNIESYPSLILCKNNKEHINFKDIYGDKRTNKNILKFIQI
mgnify:FL=1|tara:strand:+ start:34 stop:1608 length:1575 start_codon:yes stop_codon:yes gene_type:complete